MLLVMLFLRFCLTPPRLDSAGSLTKMRRFAALQLVVQPRWIESKDFSQFSRPGVPVSFIQNKERTMAEAPPPVAVTTAPAIAEAETSTAPASEAAAVSAPEALAASAAAGVSAAEPAKPAEPADGEGMVVDGIIDAVVVDKDDEDDDDDAGDDDNEDGNDDDDDDASDAASSAAASSTLAGKKRKASDADSSIGSVGTTDTGDKKPKKKSSSGSGAHTAVVVESGPHQGEKVPTLRQLTIPFRNTKRTMKLNVDPSMIVQQEAAMVTTYAMELFFARFAHESLQNAKKKNRTTIRYEDVAEARTMDRNKNFLDYLIP